MDALSDVLRVVRLKGGAFLHAEFTTPWCIQAQIAPEDCGTLLGGVEHLVLYHYVVEGRLRAQIPCRRHPAASVALRYPSRKRSRLGEEFARVRRPRDRGAPGWLGDGARKTIRAALCRSAAPVR